MIKLTARQQEILDLIRDCIDDTGLPPTRAEVAKALGFKSINAAEDHLKALAKKGVINLISGASRGIQLSEESGVPLVGQVAAGEPILAEENIEEHLNIDANLFHPKVDYFLKVRGMSMQDGGILNGDYLAVHKVSQASSGQIVVARIDDEVTVKKYKRKGNQIQLIPMNPDFEIIKVNLKSDNFAIEGLAVGVLRNGKLH